jgi:hypothetical protein
MRAVNSVRPWRVIAEELSHENDSEKITRLALELDHALDDEQKSHRASEPTERREKGAAA